MFCSCKMGHLMYNFSSSCDILVIYSVSPFKNKIGNSLNYGLVNLLNT